MLEQYAAESLVGEDAGEVVDPAISLGFANNSNDFVGLEQPAGDAFFKAGGVGHGLQFDFENFNRHRFLPYVGAAHPLRMPRNSLPATYRRFRHQASAMHSISTFIPKLNCTPQVVRAGGSFGKNLRYTAFMFSNSSMS